MKTKLIFKQFLLIVLFSLCSSLSFGQGQSKKEDTNKGSNVYDSIYMTWNKSTPETEMNDDISALENKGITIRYYDLKRNSKNEIIGIKVTYADKKGNNGALEMNNNTPINTIHFFRDGDQIGFGTPSNQPNTIAGNDFFGNFQQGGQNLNDIMKQFQFNFDGDENGGNFNFKMPDMEGLKDGKRSSKSKIIIKKDNRKPLVIEDGKVIEGAEDYSKEEIEEIQKNNRSENFNEDSFDTRNKNDLENFHKKMEESRKNMEKKSKSKLNESQKKNESDTKNELEKMREEMDLMKKEMEKMKSKIKYQKA
jgi:hypothetical protein